jgi:hypothetical protein
LHVFLDKKKGGVFHHPAFTAPAVSGFITVSF